MSREALLADLTKVRGDVDAYFRALPLDALFRREGDAWAPVDDLRHLTLSVAKVTEAFRMPPVALRERFGAAEGPSRSRERVGAIALSGLAAGGKATPGISPEPTPADEQTEAYREACLDAWQASAQAFETVLATWSDQDLETHQFPHPFLGLFSLREWADFNVLHAQHHIRVAERRLGRG